MNKHRRYKELGRRQGRKLFPAPDCVCPQCNERPATDIHHKDGDTYNNVIENISYLCRSCHLKADHAAGRLPLQTQLTAEQISAIKDKSTNLSAMARKIGLTLRYLQKIRQGKNNPKPVATAYTPFLAPDDWEYKDLRGKPRALTVKQAKHILSYKPTLGTQRAFDLAKEYKVNISTVWKARGRHRCYADSIYD